MNPVNLKDSAQTKVILDMRRCDIEKFTNETQKLNWNCVINISHAQATYSEFHRVVYQKYHRWLPYRKIYMP